MCSSLICVPAWAPPMDLGTIQENLLNDGHTVILATLSLMSSSFLKTGGITTKRGQRGHGSMREIGERIRARNEDSTAGNRWTSFADKCLSVGQLKSSDEICVDLFIQDKVCLYFLINPLGMDWEDSV